MATLEPHPPNRRKSDRRAEILKGAREVFLERGYSGASTDEIVKRCGGSKETIYSHFGSKLGLFRAVLLEQVSFISVDFESFDAGDLASTLRAIGRWYVHQSSDESVLRFVRIYLAEIDRIRDFAAEVNVAGSDSLRAVIGLAIRTYQTVEHSNEEIETLAQAYFDMLTGPAFVRPLFEPWSVLTTRELDALVERTLAMMLRLTSTNDGAGAAAAPPRHRKNAANRKPR